MIKNNCKICLSFAQQDFVQKRNKIKKLTFVWVVWRPSWEKQTGTILKQCINNKKTCLSGKEEKKKPVFDTTAKQAMWRWRQVATASQSGRKRESEVRVTSGCRSAQKPSVA